ncbi:pleckstrin homology-like domain-containing protein [Polypterus senegalus]|uniref:pleckstrin homology-like domain-containing protein n=1 Tax=Polypterus senegalus TaxID=55291 RepID=UPI0019634477|nr:pleckstrin homology-like domain-containing protein [Polypterus senegalus]
MAEESATSNGSLRNFTTHESTSKRGWLFKRSHFTHRWKPAWFVLHETQLMYGKNETAPLKKINLIGAHVKEADSSNQEYIWTVTPLDSKRTFFLKAGSEVEQQEWMEAVAEVLMKSSKGGSYHACIVQ